MWKMAIGVGLVQGFLIWLLRRTAKPPRRKFGTMKGRIYIRDDFDAPLPAEVQAGFESEP